MSSAHVNLSDGSNSYRFLRVEAANDGSLYVMLGAGEKRVSYHATGTVHYYGMELGSRIFFEPLFDVTQPNEFLYFSIPDVTRCPLTQAPDRGAVTLNVPTNQRLRFVLAIAPLDYDTTTIEQPTLRLGYETFALLLHAVSSSDITMENTSDMFFFFRPSIGRLPNAVCGKGEAELAFYQKATGNKGLIVFGPNGDGVYTLYPAVEMHHTPEVRIVFSDPNYAVERVDHGSAPHRIRFRVRDSHGQILKAPDLRQFIRSIELSAEL